MSRSAVTPYGVVGAIESGLTLRPSAEWRAARPDLDIPDDVASLIDTYVTTRRAFEAAESALYKAAGFPRPDSDAGFGLVVPVRNRGG